MSPRSGIVLLVSVVAGFLVALLTGWIAAVVILPTATLGLPYLLAAPARARIRRVQAMEVDSQPWPVLGWALASSRR